MFFLGQPQWMGEALIAKGKPSPTLPLPFSSLCWALSSRWALVISTMAGCLQQVIIAPKLPIGLVETLSGLCLGSSCQILLSNESFALLTPYASQRTQLAHYINRCYPHDTICFDIFPLFSAICWQHRLLLLPLLPWVTHCLCSLGRLLSSVFGVLTTRQILTTKNSLNLIKIWTMLKK